MIEQKGCCGIQEGESACHSGGYETVNIAKTRNVCPMCHDYSRKEVSKPVVIMCCEGACLRGEIARQASNLICHSLAPEKRSDYAWWCIHHGYGTERPSEKRQEGHCNGGMFHRMRLANDERRCSKPGG